MPSITHVKSCRKEQKCSKCGIDIPKGSPYRWFAPGFRASKIVRCMSPACAPKPSETASSDFARGYLAAYETFEEIATKVRDSNTPTSLLECRTLDTEIDEIFDHLRGDLEELCSEEEEKFDNLPENFQDGEMGELIQERQDMCQMTVDGLGDYFGADWWPSEELAFLEAYELKDYEKALQLSQALDCEDVDSISSDLSQLADSLFEKWLTRLVESIEGVPWDNP